MNPFLFIVGSPRSGTTLLQRIIDAHPEIAIWYTPRWMPRWLEKQTRHTDGMVTPELITRLLEHEEFSRLNIGRSELEMMAGRGQPVPYGSFVSELFDLYGKQNGKPLVGNKTTSYARQLDSLHCLWPGAKFVHLIRDGRDVCLSVMGWRSKDLLASRFPTWRQDPVSTTAAWWRREVRLSRNQGKQLGTELYYELRYESLVAFPEQECSALCDFLGVPYAPAMLRFHEDRPRIYPRLDKKVVLQPITPGLRDWRSQMSSRDLNRFEATAGDLLDELDYPRAFSSPQPELRRYARKIRDSVERGVRISRDRLPERQQINPVAFLLGSAGKDGLVRLGSMLDAHPQVAVISDTDWIPGFFAKRRGLTPDGLVTREFISRLCEDQRFPNLKISREELERLLASGERVPYTVFVSGIYDLYGQLSDKQLVADQTPSYIRKIRTLHSMWPRAKYVHFIRDGRNVCQSVMNWTCYSGGASAAQRFSTWSEDPISTEALYWKRNVQIGREDGRSLVSELYCELRYEALAENPGATCAALCAFLSLPYDEAMLRPQDDLSSTHLGQPAGWAQPPPTRPPGDEFEMSRDDFERFEAAAGDLLDELGYRRLIPDPGEERKSHAARILDLFTADVRSRSDRLPQGWPG